jgi:hypothetical protein
MWIMSKVREKTADYPAQTPGSRMAAKARAKSNALSEGKRADLFHKGMTMIYGSAAKKTARAGH